jgi:two-component system, OmpR family, aerobic respiration control sensor histidine kinase ArcB
MTDNIYAKDLPQDEADLFELDPYPLFDLENGIQVRGSEEAVRRSLQFMINEDVVMKDVEKMKLAHEAKDWNKVQELAHKIKGGAVYIGTVRMKMACQYLERYWKIGQREHLEKLYQQLLVVIDETHAAVTRWLGRV